MRLNRRSLRDFGKSNSGQSIVELAIMSPLILLLLAGTIDFGRYMYDGILLGNAAKAGVQYGSATYNSSADNAGMDSAAIADAAAIPSPSPTATSFTQCVPADCSTTHVLTFVQVKISGTFTPIFKIPGLPSKMTITRTATAQVSPQ